MLKLLCWRLVCTATGLRRQLERQFSQGTPVRACRDGTVRGDIWDLSLVRRVGGRFSDIPALSLSRGKLAQRSPQIAVLPSLDPLWALMLGYKLVMLLTYRHEQYT